MNSQLWTRLYDYIHEYQYMVYEYYAKDAIAFLVTYYHLNKEETVWDTTDLFGGYYEKIGDLTGVKWDKILLLPIFFIEDVMTAFDANTESGQIKINETSIVIPSEYGFTPYPNDLLKFEQSYLRPINDSYPIFSVTGVEVGPNTDRRFWKLKIETEQSRTLEEVDAQVADVYSFFDYDKKIHPLNEATLMAQILEKNQQIGENLKLEYDQSTGFYFI